jgi:WD40 repeat protein
MITAEHIQAIGAGPSVLKLRNVMTGEILQELTGHGGIVVFLEVSSDGSVIASGARSIGLETWGKDNTIRIWDLQTGAVRHVLEHDAWIRSMALSADGSVVVSTTDEEVRVWDAERGTLSAAFDPRPGGLAPDEQHPEIGRENVVLLPGGTAALSVASYPGRMTKWDLRTGDVLGVAEGPFARRLVVTPDGTSAFTCGGSALVEWDIAPLRPAVAIDGLDEWLECLALSTGAETLFVGANALQFWPIRSIEAGVQPTQPSDYSKDVYDVTVAHAAGAALTASFSGEFALWDLATGRRRASRQRSRGGFAPVAVLQDGQTALSSRGRTVDEDINLELWDLETGETLRTFHGTARTAVVALAANANIAVTGHSSRDDGTSLVCAWDIVQGTELWATPVRYVEGVALGSSVAVAVGNGIGAILDLADGREQRSFFNYAKHVALTPDGEYFVTGATDSARSIPPEVLAQGAYYEVGTHFWRTADGREMHGGSKEIYDNTAGVNALAVSRLSPRAAVACDDGAIRIWDVVSGSLQRLLRHDAAVTDLVLSPDDRWLVACSEDGACYIWDIDTGERSAAFYGDASFSACAAADDWESFIVAQGGGTVHVLRLENPPW